MPHRTPNLLDKDFMRRPKYQLLFLLLKIDKGRTHTRSLASVHIVPEDVAVTNR